MATITHEVPEWETPSSPPKKGLFSKSNLFATQSNPVTKEESGEDTTTVRRHSPTAGYHTGVLAWDAVASISSAA